MTKYVVKLSEEDLQIIKDCHSKNPSIMKAMNEAKKEDQFQSNKKTCIPNDAGFFYSPEVTLIPIILIINKATNNRVTQFKFS